MIREALEYIVDRGKVQTFDTEETTLYTRQLFAAPETPTPITLRFHRLMAMCDYINMNPDGVKIRECILQIDESGTDVIFLGPVFGYHAQRIYYSQVTAVENAHKFGMYMSLERFNIYLRTHFQENDGLLTILRVTENVASNEIREIVDDGMAQQATIKKGIAGRGIEDVPRRVTLQPFVTFPEIEQPEREFLLRLSSDDDEMGAALFDCDGNNWRLVAADRVANFLREELDDSDVNGPLILA